MTILHHSLKEHSTIRQEKNLTQSQIDSMVISIVSKLDTDYKMFTHASKQYNSDFFKGETEEFKSSLCKALTSHFSKYTNSYWVKNSNI